jgi:hypothetical protein
MLHRIVPRLFGTGRTAILRDKYGATYSSDGEA